MNTLQIIQDTVENYFNLPRGSCQMKTRKKQIVEVRQICMFFAEKYKLGSLAKIGKFFNKDHATVIHAIKRINDLIFSDKKMRLDIAYFKPVIEYKICKRTIRKSPKPTLKDQIREICGYHNPVNMRIALNDFRVNQLV